MKPANHKETPTTIDKTPSNNIDTNKRDNEIYGLKAGYGQHTSPNFPNTTLILNILAKMKNNKSK